MKDTILEDLQKYQGPTRLPPIANKAVALYEAGGFQLNDAAKQVLREELNVFAKDLKALTDNIVALGAFAIYIRDTRNDNDTVETIARIIGEHAPKYAPIGDRVVGALQEMAMKASDVFDAFSGAAGEKKRAPKFGETGPAGTMPLKALKPVNAPPPRPKKPPQKKK